MIESGGNGVGAGQLGGQVGDRVGRRAVPREAHQAAHYVHLLRWAACLLPAAQRPAALAELAGTGLAAAGADCLAPGAVAVADEEPTPAGPVAPSVDPSGALRACRTVDEGDALLAGAPVDWAAVADAHRREPFRQVEQLRALLGRPDCPEDLTLALLTPWSTAAANRLTHRKAALPDPVRGLLLPHTGEVRFSLLRHLLATGDPGQALRATSRVDVLLRAADGFDSARRAALYALWDALGVWLRAELGEDRRAWLVAAERLRGHAGPLTSLLPRLARPPRHRLPLDLRVLAQAPPAVLTALLAALDDAELEEAAAYTLRGVRMREEVLVHALERMHGAGLAPRAPYARWALGSWDIHYRPPELRAWLYGRDERLDARLERSAVTEPHLRRLLAARRPPRAPAEDLVAELRAHPDAVAAQHVLDTTLPEQGTPWEELIAAHERDPLPEGVLCALSSRARFPAVLAAGMSRHLRLTLAGQGSVLARSALAVLPEPTPFPARVVDADPHRAPAVIGRVRAGRALKADEVLAAARPAGAALDYGRTVDDAEWHAACASLLAAAAARSGPGLWRLLAQRLPTHPGSLPDLLAPRRGDATALWLYGLDPQDAPVALLDHYETLVRGAAAARSGRHRPDVPRVFTSAAAAVGWLDEEWPTLLAAARAAQVHRPGLTVALPVLLAEYLVGCGQLAELVPLSELARDTARRIGDRHGEATAWGSLGIALQRLKRYEEAVAAHVRARDLMRETGDREREGRTSRNLGNTLALLGRREEAAARLREAVACFQDVGNRAGTARVSRDLGDVLRGSGRTDEAVAAYRTALALSTGSEDGKRRAEVEEALRRLAPPAAAAPGADGR
ncbi:tetratricopeptide repeat protein [Streptomyces polyrhachis]|uniref:Tetratricopeptide repeat protein n=1 Tax=Streptomyces polyrhachis TaxID=1282885 RepID=A0ABW2GJN3_9ACTN